MMGDYDGGMAWWMIFSGILFMLFWVGLIGLAAWLFAGLSSSTRQGRADPLDTAKERYAHGDISREEFEQIRRDLSGAV